MAASSVAEDSRTGRASKSGTSGRLADGAGRIESRTTVWDLDSTRLGSLADASDPWIEPVIELLAFFGLAVFPIRGRGVDPSGSVVTAVRTSGQRGWRKAPGSNEPRRFIWPAWRQPLSAAGVVAVDGCLETVLP